ncbi:MAG TPA: tetratricopeptide repeat protein, partial [Firmicutes bacterium]|nr:tetratricopeptide repeat protein [Bacillota bacterium]
KVYIEYQKKNYRTVVKYCEKILKNNPKNVEIMKIMGDAYLKREKTEQAIKAYENAAMISKERNLPEKTIPIYKKLIDLKPEDGTYYFLLAQMYELSGLNEEAANSFEKASDKYIKGNLGIQSLNSLQNSIRLKPWDINLRLKLANNYKIENLIHNALTEYISVAKIYCDKGAYETALSIVKKALEIEPNNPEVHYGMAIIYLYQKEIKKSMDEFKATISLNPGHLKAYLELAKLYFSQKNFSNADMIYRRCLKIHSECIPAIEGIGDIFSIKKSLSDTLEYYSWALRLYTAKDSLDDMERIYRKILNFFPENAFALEGWGDLSVRKGMLTEAVDKYKRVMEMYLKQGLPQNAIELGHKIQKINPGDPDIRKRISDIEYSMKFTDGVNFPASGKGELEDTAVIFENAEANLILEEIYKFRKKKEFNSAIDSAKILLKKVPNDIKALELLGDLYCESSNFRGAIFAFGTAAEIAGKKGDISSAYKIYKKMTESLEKVEVFDTGIGEKTEILIKDYMKQAENFVDNGKISQAADICKKILSIYPEHTGAREKLTEISLIDIFDERIKRSISDDDFYSHFNLGIAFREMGMFEKAINHFESTAKSLKYFLQACDMISDCYEQLNNYDLAILWCNKGLQNTNFKPEEKLELKYRLGCIYEKQGNIGSALKWFSDVFKEDYNFRNIGQKVALLSQKLKNQ